MITIADTFHQINIGNVSGGASQGITGVRYLPLYNLMYAFSDQKSSIIVGFSRLNTCKLIYGDFVLYLAR